MLLHNILNLWKIHEQLSIIIICLHTQNEIFFFFWTNSIGKNMILFGKNVICKYVKLL